MIYLDTGCIVKLYYPEPDSARVVELVSGRPIAFVALHELELSNALELKLYRKEATRAQVRAVHALVEDDERSGVLHRPTVSWDDLLREAVTLARAHTQKLGCRSLDILHCSIARSLPAELFVTTDARQRRMALKTGLRCPDL